MLRITDADHDGLITRPELLQLHIQSEYFAKSAALSPPNSLPELLDAIYLGFDRNNLASQLALQDEAKDALAIITQALKVGVWAGSSGPSSRRHERWVCGGRLRYCEQGAMTTTLVHVRPPPPLCMWGHDHPCTHGAATILGVRSLLSSHRHRPQRQGAVGGSGGGCLVAGSPGAVGGSCISLFPFSGWGCGRSAGWLGYKC